MSHRIAEAIIENGQIKYIDKKLPPKNLRSILSTMMKKHSLLIR